MFNINPRFAIGKSSALPLLGCLLLVAGGANAAEPASTLFMKCGLGSDFDGMPDTPVGLEGVDCYPALLAELMRRGWTDSDIAKLAGENLLRVMSVAEQVGLGIRRPRISSSNCFCDSVNPFPSRTLFLARDTAS